MSESSTVRFVRPITAAAGVYAPGHIGELTQYLPFELVDDVLSETKTVQRRLRDLPSRVGVYFVLALMLFPRLATPGSGRNSPPDCAAWSCRVRRRRRCGICAAGWARRRSRRCSRSLLGRWGSRAPPG